MEICFSQVTTVHKRTSLQKILRKFLYSFLLKKSPHKLKVVYIDMRAQRFKSFSKDMLRIFSDRVCVHF